MKHTLRFLCVLSLFALLLAAQTVKEDLPAEDDVRILDRYTGWSGVIEVWISADCPSGTVRWIESCATSFERAHDGVYLYTSLVSPEIIANRRTNGARLPDIIVFLPCSFEERSDLCDLSSVWACADIRAGLRGIDRRCIPVAMGAYALAYTTDNPEPRGVCYPTSDTHAWSAALLCLLESAQAGLDTPPPDEPGLDLGLTAAIGSEGAQTSFPGSGFSFTDSAISDFVSGKADTMVVSQREISRLNSMAVYPDFRIRMPDSTMPADQLLLLSVLRTGDAEREELAAEFSAHLLGEDCQAAVTALRSFPVLADSAVYGRDLMLGLIEANLDRLHLATPDVFSPYWRDAASLLYGKCAAGGLSLREAVEQLRNAS